MIFATFLLGGSAIIKLLAVILAAGAIFGTTITVAHPQPLIPASSPDQDTIVAQAENLRAQFEVLTGTTDVIQGGGGALSSLPSVGSAVPISGKSLINTAGVDACTLATPVAGDPSQGGNDGLTIEVTDLSGHAHTVTTAANKINGNKHIATFPGTVGARIVLTAFNGIWYSDGGGTTLS
jgi:hypothetical protein